MDSGQLPAVVANAARQVVGGADYVTLADLPDGDGFTLTARPTTDMKHGLYWIVPAVGIVAVVLTCLDLPSLLSATTTVKLRLGTWGCFGLTLMVVLIRAVNGPPRPARLEVRPGMLRAERWIAGDRVVSSYAGAEVQYLVVEDSSLWIATRMGETPLIGFGKRQVNVAIATLVALAVWPGGFVATPSSRGGFDRLLFGPVPADGAS